MTAFNPIRLMRDGLINIISGLGTGSDKNSYGQYEVRLLSQHQLEASYRTSAWSRKVHDIIPYEMTRAGRDWIGDKAQIAKIEKEEERLNLWHGLYSSLQTDRLFGGCGYVIGIAGEAPELPLDVKRVRPGQLRYLIPFNRYQLVPDQINWNPESEYFARPEWFRVQTQGTGRQVRFHASRVVGFNAQALPVGAITANSSTYWGDPLLMSLWGVLMRVDTTQGDVAALVNEAKTDTLTVPDFGNNITTEAYEKQWKRRLEVAGLFQSMFNIKIIDGGSDGVGEKWETRQLNFANLPETMQAFLQFLAGASDIPYTRLAGQSPGGMNSTGKGEQVDFEKAIDARRDTNLKPQLNVIDEVLLRSAGVEPNDELFWKFAPLSQLTEKEQAEVEKLQAETVQIYSNSGLFDPDALAEAALNGIVERGVALPGLEQAVEAAGPVDREPVDDTPEEDEDIPLIERQAPTDAAPRTLYVSRKLLNADEFIRWAKAQGFETTTPADQMHVTVAFSRAPVDWMKMGQDWVGEDGKLTVAPGGARIVEPLGDKGAVVLLFNSSELSWRHEAMRREGASWDFPEYQPHVTITYRKPDGLDVSQVEPFRGALEFGPEIFAEVVDDWEKTPEAAES